VLDVAGLGVDERAHRSQDDDCSGADILYVLDDQHDDLIR
jgi:hypothetical protein